MRDVVEGIVLALLSLMAVWGAWQVPAAAPGDTWAGIVPFAAAITLLALSGLMILGGMRVTGGLQDKTEGGDAGILDILILFAVALLYQQSLRWFGYVLPTAVVAPVVFRIFGVRSWIGLATSVVLCPLAFHVVFFELLGVFPPHGEMFDVLDWLRR